MNQKGQTTPAQESSDLLPGDKSVRQAAVAVSVDKRDDLLVKSDLMNDTRQLRAAEESHGVSNETEIQMSKGLRLLRTVLTILTVLTGIIMLLNFALLYLPVSVPVIIFLLSATARGVLALLEHQRRQRAWIKKMGWDHTPTAAEKKQRRKLIAGISAGVILAVAVFCGILWFSQPFEHPGSSTDGLTMENYDFASVILHFNPRYEMDPDVSINWVLADDRVYFTCAGVLYSANSDTSDPVIISEQVWYNNRSGQSPEQDQDPVYSLIWEDGYLYYITASNYGGSTKTSLMRLKTGGRVSPKKLYSSHDYFNLLRLNDDGSIALYYFDRSWTYRTTLNP